MEYLKIQGNKLITEFMEWERYYPGTAPKENRSIARFRDKEGKDVYHNFIDGIGKDVYPPFDSDWNYLMLVIDKIESLKHEGMEFFVEIRCKNDGCTIDVIHMKSRVNVYCETTEVNTTKIDAVWRAIVDFLKWYIAVS